MSISDVLIRDMTRRREIDAILVTELSRWGRSTSDLVDTLDELHAQGVSVLAQTGLSFDLATPSGKLMRTIMAGLAEFERDLIRERVKSGMAVAKAKIERDGHFVIIRWALPTKVSTCTNRWRPLIPKDESGVA